MTRKVSIIVPIYNVGEYLKPCVDSLLRQTYTNVEIILVDDGSTDGSGEIVDSFDDQRIVKIHTENQGVTAARKTGWMNSTGDYCLFVDGDDMLASDAVEFFMNKVKIKEYDIITGWHKKIYPNGEITQVTFPFRTGEYSNREYIINSLRAVGSVKSHWLSIYKRSAITEKAFDFDRGFYFAQDSLMFLAILNDASTILCTDYVFYHYIQRPTSTSHTVTPSNEYFRRYFKKRFSILDDELKPLIYLHVMKKMAPNYIRETHWTNAQVKKEDYDFLLRLKAACPEKLPLRLRLEFIIMRSRLLSYLYRTVGWSLASKIKRNILHR